MFNDFNKQPIFIYFTKSQHYLTFRMFLSKTSNAHPSVNTKGVKQRVKKEFRNILTKWIVYILHIVSEQIVRQTGGQQHKTLFSKKDLKSVHN